MDIDDFIILTDLDVEEPELFSTSSFRPRINATNVHTGVWALFHTYVDDERLSPEQTDTFQRARDSLDEFITPEVLLDILEESASNYTIDAENMMVYATDIILINEEIRSYAQ